MQIPSSNPPSRFVNSQLVCLLPAGIFNHVYVYLKYLFPMFQWHGCELADSPPPSPLNNWIIVIKSLNRAFEIPDFCNSNNQKQGPLSTTEEKVNVSNCERLIKPYSIF